MGLQGLFPVRGGSPRIAAHSSASASSLPRTRGFTLLPRRLARRATVSSPYAGVHPRSHRRCRSARSLFPVRGGSPTHRSSPAGRPSSLPRTRGFTLLELEQHLRWNVSSPYAGVHPAPPGPSAAAPGLFPVRGGSPGYTVVGKSACVSLPRTRGFTPVQGAGPRCRHVSSPYAGVHPKAKSCSASPPCLFPVRGGSPQIDQVGIIRCRSLPRTRGFTPSRPESDPFDFVSSPYAGVHPCGPYRNLGHPGLFPVCGGSPPTGPARAAAALSLPRTRGFTRGRQIHGRLPRVSSPYAGVHPYQAFRWLDIGASSPSAGVSCELDP